MNWEEYLSNPQYRSDNEARKKFGSDLMLAFKQKNISEGMNWMQAVHLHDRVKNWTVTYPTAEQFPNPAYAPYAAAFAGRTKSIDVFNMMAGGDIETCCLSVMFGQNDDMTLPEHWITEEKRQWLITQMSIWLGWA